MEQSTRITPNTKNEDAYNAYYNAAETATLLRSMVTMKGAGCTKSNKRSKFVTFKNQFDFLYMLTRTSRDVDRNLVDEINKWVKTSPKCDDKCILNSIDLFEKYTKNLSDKGVY